LKVLFHNNLFKLNIKYLFLFVIVLIFLTPIGTILHELGHIVVAKSLGYRTVLHHSSMSWDSDFKSDLMDRYLENKFEIENNLSFKNSRQYNIDILKLNKDKLLIYLGGVFQTIFIGSLGFLLLYKRRKSEYFTIKDWILVFISLFWSREILNLIVGVIRGLFNKEGIYFYGDEAKISKLLNLPDWSILLPLGAIAVIVIVFIIKLIPNKLRYTFILSGIIGSPIGYFLWMHFLGSKILP